MPLTLRNLLLVFGVVVSAKSLLPHSPPFLDFAGISFLQMTQILRSQVFYSLFFFLLSLECDFIHLNTIHRLSHV